MPRGRRVDPVSGSLFSAQPPGSVEVSRSAASISLANSTGAQWLRWFGPAADLMPEMKRALDLLEAIYPATVVDSSLTAAELKFGRSAISKFVGQARCPSVSSCEKLAIRAKILTGWLGSMHHQQPSGHEGVALEWIGLALQKFLTISEGADDRHGVLVRAIRDLCRLWIDRCMSGVQSGIERAHLLYPVAMMDQTGLVDASWWWRALASADQKAVLALAEEEVTAMQAMQPSNAVNWKSFDKRWRRTRLKGLLQHLGEERILAELLRKSAVDDFEAAQAVEMLRKAGRAREAITQAEAWMRALPKSPVLAEQLLALYLDDGWDDEAVALAVSQYHWDPNPRWLDTLKRLGTPVAIQALQDIQSQQTLS